METELQRKCKTCPENGEPCVDGFRPDFKPHTDGKIYACRWWTAVKGKDPQSETILDFYDCSVPWMPVIGIEQSQMTRQNTATMQDFRNETHEKFGGFNKVIEQAAIAFHNLAEMNRQLLDSAVPLPSIENKENNGHEQ
jgi:hypothetical protein